MSQPVVQLRSRLPKIADAAIARARLTVVPRTRTKTARVPFVVLVSMLLLGGVVGLLLFNTSMQQASFAATALDAQATTLGGVAPSVPGMVRFQPPKLDEHGAEIRRRGWGAFAAA